MATLDFEAKVEQNKQAIQAADKINDRNAELLLEWCRDMELSDLSLATIQKRTSHLKIVAEHLGDTEFFEVDKDGMKDLVEWINSRDTADSTKEGYKKIIRFFWRWLWEHENQDWDPRDDFPPVVAWIEPDSHASNDVLPQNLLTNEDIEELIETGYNARDRAFVAFLYETGARIGEIIDLTVGDIEDRQKGKKVVIDGKTGPRRLPLKDCVPHLNRWLNEHPTGESEDPLWTKLRSPESVSYNYIRQKILQKTADRADIDKPVNPHHYRHSRASELATEFTEAQLCEWFGWVQGSDQPAKYVHLSGRDIDDAFDNLHGEDTSDTVRESYHDECPRCEWLNEDGVKFCGRCGFDLEEGEDAPETDVVSKAIDEVLQDIYPDADPQAIEDQKGMIAREMVETMMDGFNSNATAEDAQAFAQSIDSGE